MHGDLGTSRTKIPILGPQNQLICLIPWERMQRNDPLKPFGGIWESETGVKSNGAVIFGYKKRFH